MSVENQGSTRTELARSFKPDAAARKCSSCWQLAPPAPGLQGSGCSQHHAAQGSGHTAPSTPSRPGPDARRDNFNSPATGKLLARGRKAAVQRARIKQKDIKLQSGAGSRKARGKHIQQEPDKLQAPRLKAFPAIFCSSSAASSTSQALLSQGRKRGAAYTSPQWKLCDGCKDHWLKITSKRASDSAAESTATLLPACPKAGSRSMGAGPREMQRGRLRAG